MRNNFMFCLLIMFLTEVSYADKKIKNLLASYRFSNIRKFLTLPLLCFIIVIELFDVNKNDFVDIFQTSYLQFGLEPQLYNVLCKLQNKAFSILSCKVFCM